MSLSAHFNCIGVLECDSSSEVERLALRRGPKRVVESSPLMIKRAFNFASYDFLSALSLNLTTKKYIILSIFY